MEEKAMAETATAITAYGIPLSPFISFKYLGRFLSESDKDLTEVVHNLQREQQKRTRLSRVLGR